MSGDQADDVQRLLECFKRGQLQGSPPSRIGSRRRQSSSCSGMASESAVSPHTPSRVAREVVRIPQKAENENSIEKHELRPVAQDVATPDYKKLGAGASEVSPGVFYGSSVKKPAKRPPQLIRLLHEIQQDLALQENLTYREAIWATFPRQDQAIQFADSHGRQDLTVFQYQDHLNGQRRFLATNYDEFWQRYSRMQAEWRHHYEIIRQGRPCHLYFDLEFNIRANPNASGEAMVDTLLSVMSDVLLDVFSLHYEPSWTVELDSSTTEKFSRHLIIHIPGAAFKDNLHVGAFVGEMCKRMATLRDSDEQVSKLFPLQGDSWATHQADLFVDLAVYTRNRSFRLPLSSKAGKTALLLPTGRFRCSNLGEREVFMESLICRVEEGCQKLLTYSTENAGQGGTLDFKSWISDPSRLLQGAGTTSNYGKSPFPLLEGFVESIACIGDIQGKIRSWYYFADYGVVVYNISGNRFCERIGRQHKSNNVMYIVHFRTAGFYQKCHDPDCRDSDKTIAEVSSNCHIFQSLSRPDEVSGKWYHFHWHKGYQSPLRPIPRHTIPPEFPLSTASTLGNEQTSWTDCLADQTVCDIDEWHDETWWEEVVASVGDLNCESQAPISTSQGHHSNDTVVVLGDEEDKEWWDAVERQAMELESSQNLTNLRGRCNFTIDFSQELL